MSAATYTRPDADAAELRQRATRLLALVDMARALPLGDYGLPEGDDSTDDGDKLSALLLGLTAELQSLHSYVCGDDDGSGARAATVPPAAQALADRTAPASVPDLLQQLAGWMQASGIEAGHPWRIAIASCLARIAGCTVAPFGPGGRLASLDAMPEPRPFLAQVAGWLDAAGYDSAHPWQVAIAATLAAAAGDPQAGASGAHLQVAEIEGFATLAEQVRALLIVLSEYPPGAGKLHADEVRKVNALHDLAEGTATRLRDALIAAAEHAMSRASRAQGGAA